MEPEVKVRIVEIAAKWAENANKDTGQFSNKRNWEVFDTIYKSMEKTIEGKEVKA